MRVRTLGLSLLLATTLCAARPTKHDALIVHEWGTFLTMNGSDGMALDGMYHEEHALPAFVHARSRDQLHLPNTQLKGETPVIYFYTNQEQNVNVTVDFPKGLWTQWYPQASVVGPTFARVASPASPSNGSITWYAKVIPSEKLGFEPPIPKTQTDALWNFARQVDAAYVRMTDETQGTPKQEYERFLFYRGLGRATLPLSVTAADSGTLSLSAAERFEVNHLFVLRVEGGKGVFRYLPKLAPGDKVTNAIPPLQDALPLQDFSKKLGQALEARLVESGLYPKEARAMVNTWRTSYFETEGVRVLFIMPQGWTNAFIPMKLDPKPTQLVRVMVGRTELLTAGREKKFADAVRDLAAPDAAVRERAFETLREQGRYVEPMLRHTVRTTNDAQTRMLCKRLLLTDYAQEIRAAIHAATDGKRLHDDPVHVRAQLVSVLKEMGLDQEAKEEAMSVLSALKQRPEPDLKSDRARHTLRAFARASEGLDDDLATAGRYSRLIEFGSGVKSGCGACHDGNVAPHDMAWFHDWYAGRKFANYIARAGRTEQTIQEQETALKRNANDTAARMRLAYLYAAKGEKARAATQWANLESKGRRLAKE